MLWILRGILTHRFLLKNQVNFPRQIKVCIFVSETVLKLILFSGVLSTILIYYDFYSICKNFFINTFPLKHPDSNNIYYNLSDFYSLKILPHNIGSDVGFKKVFDYIINNYSLTNQSITPVLLDINIYWRF